MRGEDVRTRAIHQFLVLYGLADERHDAPHIALLRAADVLILIGVDHRPDAIAAEEFGKQRLVRMPVEQVHARHPLAASTRGSFELETEGTLTRWQAAFF